MPSDGQPDMWTHLLWRRSGGTPASATFLLAALLPVAVPLFLLPAALLPVTVPLFLLPAAPLAALPPCPSRLGRLGGAGAPALLCAAAASIMFPTWLPLLCCCSGGAVAVPAAQLSSRDCTAVVASLLCAPSIVRRRCRLRLCRLRGCLLCLAPQRHAARTQVAAGRVEG